MLRESLVIHAVRAETIEVSPQNSGICQSCQLKPSCGQQLVQAMRGKRQISLPNKLMQLADQTRPVAGQQVMLEIPGSTLVKLSLLLYFVPLLLMLPILLLCEQWGLPESTTAITTFVTLGLSFLAVHRLLPGQSLQTQMRLCVDTCSTHAKHE